MYLDQQTLQDLDVGVVVPGRLGQFPVGVSVLLRLGVPHKNLRPTPKNGFHYAITIPFHRFSSVAPYLGAEVGSRLDIVERNVKLLQEFVLLISRMVGHVSIGLLMKHPIEMESKDVHVSSPDLELFFLLTYRSSLETNGAYSKTTITI